MYFHARIYVYQLHACTDCPQSHSLRVSSDSLQLTMRKIEGSRLAVATSFRTRTVLVLHGRLACGYNYNKTVTTLLYVAISFVDIVSPIVFSSNVATPCMH